MMLINKIRLEDTIDMGDEMRSNEEEQLVEWGMPLPYLFSG